MQFSLTEEELIIYRKWLNEHNKECIYSSERESSNIASLTGAIGGRLSFIFTPTGLGNIVQVKCICGATNTLTNFENW